MDYSEIEPRIKKPIESTSYEDDSRYVINQIETILGGRIESGENLITLTTNLKCGLPLENINKIAGPIIEAWAFEVFSEIASIKNNSYGLINVEAQSRLGMSDVILQFQRKDRRFFTGNIDVKATAEDIEKSGKSPNITSYSRIRTAYVEDPDFMFIILSIKHKVYSKEMHQGKREGIMEVVGFNAFDLKFVSDSDLSYNPALGTGQIQIKDIHYVEYQFRTTWDFCKLLDMKYLQSRRRTFDDFIREAEKNKWIK